MDVMNKWLRTGLVFVALASPPAMAADLGAPIYRMPLAVYSWTGCYIGGNVGEAWSRQNANESAAPLVLFPGSVTADNPALSAASMPDATSRAPTGLHAAGCSVLKSIGAEPSSTVRKRLFFRLGRGSSLSRRRRSR